MVQKIIKVGNSLALILPAQFIKEVRWKKGTKIYVEYNSHYKMVHVTEKTKNYQPKLTPEFISWLNKFSKKYSGALKELAEY